MRFVGFDGLIPERITRELSRSGQCFDLHNDWTLSALLWLIEESEVRLEWSHVDNTAAHFALVFEGVSGVAIESSDVPTPSDPSALSNLIYQAIEGSSPFVRFWLGDGKSISVTAESLTMIDVS